MEAQKWEQKEILRDITPEYGNTNDLTILQLNSTNIIQCTRSSHADSGGAYKWLGRLWRKSCQMESFPIFPCLSIGLKCFWSTMKIGDTFIDKYRDIDKRMTKYWEDNMIKKVYDQIPAKKKSILVGKNHHYRILSKKVNFLISNKFILDNDIKKEDFIRSKV